MDTFNISSSSSIQGERKVVTWILGVTFVTIINLSSILGAFIVPIWSPCDTNERQYNYKGDKVTQQQMFATSRLHNGLEGLAFGSLLASSIFHLIPHAFDLIGQGIYLFYWIERMVSFLTDSSYGLFKTGTFYSDTSKSMVKLNEESRHPVTFDASIIDTSEHTNDTHDVKCNQYSEIRTSHEKSTVTCNSKQAVDEIDDDKVMTSSKLNLILMVILGDAVHNFIDGLSLGAGLIDSHLTGCSIAVAILFEEIPHELGDFWILLSSGMSVSSAIKLNLLSSASCYFGLICGMIIGEHWGGNSAIFALTAGMFLYIGLFNLLNDLKSNIIIVQSITGNSLSAVFKILLCQNIGIITGVAFLYQLACIDEKFLFQSLTISL